jgi:hypothetical protein
LRIQIRFYNQKTSCGAAVPQGTKIVASEEFKTLSIQKGFVLDTLTLREQRTAKAVVQFQLDLALRATKQLEP